MSTFRFPPAPRAQAAAGAVVAAGASAVGAAAAGLAVVAAVGADRLGAADEHALISEASTPPVKPTVTRLISVLLVNPSGGVLISQAAPSIARWVSTWARCVLYSALPRRSLAGSRSWLALAEASAAEAPPASACSTPVARIGVAAALVMPMRHWPLSIFCAPTPTIAQSDIRRRNF